MGLWRCVSNCWLPCRYGSFALALVLVLAADDVCTPAALLLWLLLLLRCLPDKRVSKANNVLLLVPEALARGKEIQIGTYARGPFAVVLVVVVC